MSPDLKAQLGKHFKDLSIWKRPSDLSLSACKGTGVYLKYEVENSGSFSFPFWNMFWNLLAKAKRLIVYGTRKQGTGDGWSR